MRRAAEVAGGIAALIRIGHPPDRSVAAWLRGAAELVGHGCLHCIARHHEVAESVKGLNQVFHLQLPKPSLLQVPKNSCIYLYNQNLQK